ncbi:MAG: hypothetical protein K0B15_11930 [Lentimicrobium sp.]|nr:hypothetical protein [Lentimicrobium sp.]
MKKLLFTLIFTTLLGFELYSQTSSQEKLSDFQEKKILLVNHLCFVRTMYNYCVVSELNFDERNKNIDICKKYLEYSSNLFTSEIKSKVSLKLAKEYDQIFQGYSKLFEQALKIEISFISTRQEDNYHESLVVLSKDELTDRLAQNLTLYKYLVDLKIDRFVQELISE